MQKTTEIRAGRHCVYAMHIHLVFVTKYRKKTFNADHLETMKKIFQSVSNDFSSVLKEFNGEEDHVHLLINYPPKISISKLVNSLKGVSSRRLKQQYPDLNRYYWKGALWSPSYFAGSCGGAPLSIIKTYIQQQKEPS